MSRRYHSEATQVELYGRQAVTESRQALEDVRHATPRVGLAPDATAPTAQGLALAALQDEARRAHDDALHELTCWFGRPGGVRRARRQALALLQRAVSADDRARILGGE